MTKTKGVQDPYANGVCTVTAQSFAKLARLRGVPAEIKWDGERYIANGEPCGPSVHGLYEWLERQPGVKP